MNILDWIKAESTEKGRTEGLVAGLAVGIKKGRTQGAEETLLRLSKRMLAHGASIDFVAQITDLPLITIHDLQNRPSPPLPVKNKKAIRSPPINIGQRIGKHIKSHSVINHSTMVNTPDGK